MSIEHNKTIARRHFEELWTKGELGVADEIYAPGAVGHCGNLPSHTGYPECEKELVRQDRVAFPDGTATVEDQIAEGDKVLTRWRFRGTHTAPLYGNPAFGPRDLRQRLPRPPHRRRKDRRDLGARRLLQPHAPDRGDPSTTDRSRLIICADYFGMHRGIVSAARERAGIDRRFHHRREVDLERADELHAGGRRDTLDRVF